MSLRSFLLGPGRTAREPERALSFDPWGTQWFNFGGRQYPFTLNQTYTPKDQEPIGTNFQGLVEGAYQTNGVVFACMLVRLLLFSEARFQFRQIRSGRPGDLFGSEALAPLEKPWPGGTTGDLLARAEQDASLAGNFFCALRPGGQLRRMRPDWVTMILGSDLDPGMAAFDVDAELLGYAYTPGGAGSGNDPQFFGPDEVAHYAPIPDPEAVYRGMSWLTPVLNEIVGDKAMNAHKIEFFERGGTPNVAVQIPAEKTENFQKWVDKILSKHPSMESRTMFLGGGADAKPIGNSFEEMQLKQVQGAGETRIAAAAGVPPVIVGLSEGLDAATYSNYKQASRRYSDLTMRPLWRNFCGSMSKIIDVPGGSELWYDDRDIAFLQDDMTDAAEIQSTQAATIRTLVDGGFTPKSAVEAVLAGDWTRLKHTDLFSVQLQPPGTMAPEPMNGTGPAQELAAALKASAKEDA